MKINVGIIGCGVIGGTLKRWISENNPDCKLLVLQKDLQTMLQLLILFL